MKRSIPFLVVAAIGVFVGVVGGWILASTKGATRLERVVAFSWRDGKEAPGFYGAHVFLVPKNGGYSVQARVYIGRGNDMFHDCGELGTVQTDAEAVARWGSIAWRTDGLHIGNGTNQYFLPRSQMESHR